MPPHPGGQRYSTRRPTSPVTYEPITEKKAEPTPVPPRPPRRAPEPPVFTRTPEKRPAPEQVEQPEVGSGAGPAAPFIRPPHAALPPSSRPLELPSAREPVLRTWHMPPAPPDAPAEPDAPPAEPAGAEPSLEGATDVPWEVEAMTAPDYTAPRSIHDPEHDSWPVAAPDGTATPAWDDVVVEHDRESAELVPEQEPLELQDVVGGADMPGAVETSLELDIADVVDAEAPAASVSDAAKGGEDVEGAGVPYVESGRVPDTPFPLDAFIVPTGAEHMPAGYLEEIGGMVADRLEALARQIRRDGIRSVGQGETTDELARVLGAIVTGYLARGA